VFAPPLSRSKKKTLSQKKKKNKVAIAKEQDK
jgi:hypothetical protein